MIKFDSYNPKSSILYRGDIEGGKKLQEWKNIDNLKLKLGK